MVFSWFVFLSLFSNPGKKSSHRYIQPPASSLCPVHILTNRSIPPSLSASYCTNSTATGARWGEPSWGPDVVGLSVGGQQQPFPLSELPGVIRPVYRPPIINPAGQPHSPLLLLFTTVYSATSPLKAVNAAQWHRVACGNGCFLQHGLTGEMKLK